MKEELFQLDEKLQRPDFKRIEHMIRDILLEASQNGDTDLQRKLLNVLSALEEEQKKSEPFKQLLFFIANKI